MHPLLDEVRRGAAGVDDLRAALAAAGGPLRTQRPDGRVDVTFVWIGNAPSVSLQSGLARTGPSAPLERIGDLPVWALAVTVDTATLVSYRFVTDDPFVNGAPSDEAAWMALALQAESRSNADPHNPAHIAPLGLLFGLDTPLERYESILALPDAPAATWFTQADATDEAAPTRGTTESFEHTSALLDTTRRITVHLPPGAGDGALLPVVVLTDGSSWLRIAGLTRAIDAAVAAGAVAPCVLALVHEPHGPTGFTGRTTELACNPRQAAMVVEELLPELRRRAPIDPSPAATVLGGASLGGLAATYAALEHAGAVGGVVSVSGSYWYGLAIDGQPEWLTRRLAEAPRAPFSLYQQIGSWEDRPFDLSPGVSHLVANRHFRDVARARGYSLVYDEMSTAHDVAAFRIAMMRGLATLLPGPAA
jgi:enterochelin esterase family protein